MDISIYFEPVKISTIIDTENLHPNQFYNYVKIYGTEMPFPDSDEIDIAIIGVNEGRASVNNAKCSQAPDSVRKYLYNLYKPNFNLRIMDLGNIKPGKTLKDTYYAYCDVVATLLKKNILPVIIGGGQDLTYANYLAYESIGRIINIVTVDPAFDLGDTESSLSSKTYLNKIITHQPSYLFNFTNIGYQSYFVDYEAVELMKKLYFDVYRLGFVQSEIEEVEPMVRNADMISVDISSVRQSDAPGNGNACPNGFYGEELCRIMRYAGLSDKLSSIGIYEINPEKDNNGQTAHLAAQAIWYFVDGFYNRKMDLPVKDKKDYIKYRVMIKQLQNEIVFFKSKKSDRWWMEVPCPTKLKSKYERHYLVPCSYLDYQTAMKEEIPDRWWQAYQKLM
ncbi:MAG: formimidoylglutamase [Bacteroidota bacterium]